MAGRHAAGAVDLATLPGCAHPAYEWQGPAAGVPLWLGYALVAVERCIGVAMLAFPDRSRAMPGFLWGVSMVLWGVLMALPLPQGSRIADEEEDVPQDHPQRPGKPGSPGPKTGASRGARRGT